MKTKYMKEDMWKSFFFINLQVDILQLDYELTSLEIVFKELKLMNALQGRSETPSNQAFESVKFITIVNPFDIFGKFF